MCGCGARHVAGEPTPYDLGRAELATGRRTLLKAGGGVAFSTAALAAAGPEAAAAAARIRTKKRVYVLVVDGCRPEEISGGQTPHLFDLMLAGKRHARARSLPIMETIPNHVMMMTGVRPDRSGVPANAIYDRRIRGVRELDRPSDLKAQTVIQTLNRRGLRTGTVLSKEYLYGIFGTRATARWEPAPIIPVSGHAPDEFTFNAAMSMVTDLDPHLMFVNLGDIDRYGHTDLTGATLGIKALRRLALAKTDAYVGRFIDLLKSEGKWRHSMVIVLADHSMDWSTPGRYVSLTGPLGEDRLLRGRVAIADNGGADLLYWTGPASQKEEAVRRMVTISRGVPGVLSAHDRRQRSMRLGPEAGDVVVFCRAGWRFSDPDPTSNPIPGNHGHPATVPIPFFISGGHPALPKRAASPLVAQTVDVAPTVAKFFGVRGAPRGGWDGRARI